MVGRKQGLLIRKGEAQVVRHVAGGLDGFEPPVRTLDHVSLAQLSIGPVLGIRARFEGVDLAGAERPSKAVGAAAEDQGPCRGL